MRRQRGTWATSLTVRKDANGSITVLMAAVLVIGAVTAALLLGAGGLAAERARVGAAADAVALAAADELAQGHGAAAARAAAAELARFNDVELDACDCEGVDAYVAVSMTIHALGTHHIAAVAHAVADFSRSSLAAGE